MYFQNVYSEKKRKLYIAETPLKLTLVDIMSDGRSVSRFVWHKHTKILVWKNTRSSLRVEEKELNGNLSYFQVLFAQ